ncbi:prolactin-like [Ctenodactylus gundi]
MEYLGPSWKGSLHPLLFLSTLLLCKNAMSHPPCPTGVDNCQTILQNFFNSAVWLSRRINGFALQLYNELDKRYSTAPWYFSDNFKPCHTASINSPESEEEAKKMSFLELFSLSRLILRSWMNPLTYLAWQTENPTIEVMQLQVETEKLLTDMDGIAHLVDPSIKEKKDYVPWLQLPALKSMSRKIITIRIAYYFLRCMISDSNKISNYMRILQCRFSYGDNC